MEPEAFIQFKGTDICMDLYCSCVPDEKQFALHFDGYFGQHIRCPNCKRVWELPATVPITDVTAQPERYMSGIPGDGFPGPPFDHAKVAEFG